MRCYRKCLDSLQYVNSCRHVAGPSEDRHAVCPAELRPWQVRIVSEFLTDYECKNEPELGADG